MAREISTHQATGDPAISDGVARVMAVLADSDVVGDALIGALLAGIHTVAVELAHTQCRCADLERRVGERDYRA